MQLVLKTCRDLYLDRVILKLVLKQKSIIERLGFREHA